MTKASRRGMAAPRGGSSAGKTPGAANTGLGRGTTTPPRRLNFSNHNNSQIKSTLSGQTGGPKHREPPVGVKGVVFGKHLSAQLVCLETVFSTAAKHFSAADGL